MTFLIIILSIFLMVILSTVIPNHALIIIFVPGIIIGLLVSINHKLDKLINPSEQDVIDAYSQEKVKED